jgi:hypothetical protein
MLYHAPSHKKKKEKALMPPILSLKPGRLDALRFIIDLVT